VLKGKKPIEHIEQLEAHNAERKAMVGKTAIVFEYTARLLKEFILQKYNRKDLYLRKKQRFTLVLPITSI
jgi:hypothetical protein